MEFEHSLWSHSPTRHGHIATGGLSLPMKVVSKLIKNLSCVELMLNRKKYIYTFSIYIYIYILNQVIYLIPHKTAFLRGFGRRNVAQTRLTLPKMPRPSWWSPKKGCLGRQVINLVPPRRVRVSGDSPRGSRSKSVSAASARDSLDQLINQQYLSDAQANGWVWHKAFFKVVLGAGSWPWHARHSQNFFGPRWHSPKKGHLRRQMINLAPSKRVRA